MFWQWWTWATWKVWNFNKTLFSSLRNISLRNIEEVSPILYAFLHRWQQQCFPFTWDLSFNFSYCRNDCAEKIAGLCYQPFIRPKICFWLSADLCIICFFEGFWRKDVRICETTRTLPHLIHSARISPTVGQDKIFCHCRKHISSVNLSSLWCLVLPEGIHGYGLFFQRESQVGSFYRFSLIERPELLSLYFTCR